ncbi:hemolysin family protein [Jeongeupia naejangsanensis]|nr:hemolysin family protein [Jeongeupia naejangsanensis]
MDPALSQFFMLTGAMLLVFLNGFFVAAEFSLVKLRPTRVKAIAKAWGFRGRMLARVHHDLDAYLSACQLGITLASLGLGWVGEPVFAALLEPVFGWVGIGSPAMVHTVSFVFAFSTISFLHIVVGELAPKSMAIRMAEKVGLWTAAPLFAFYWAMYPAIWLLNNSAFWLLRMIRLDVGHGHESHYSAEELKLILRANRDDPSYNSDAMRVLAHSLDFGKLTVADLMRPFSEAVTLQFDDPWGKQLATIRAHRFSRYPVIGDDDHVLGMVHVKDLLLLSNDEDEPDLDAHLRPALRVSEDMPADELLRRFRGGAVHFAVVGPKGEPPYGFITLDNLLGVLVGEIRDEFRQTHNDWLWLDDGSLIGKGSLPLFTLSRALGIDVDSPEVESVGGLIQEKLGRLPEEGERLPFDGFSVVVKKMHGPRIVSVRVMPTHPAGQ